MKVSMPLCQALVFGLVFASQAQAQAPVPALKKVVMVIFENTDFNQAAQQPFFASLARSGALLTNLRAETHPSQPNYIALMSGSVFDVTDDSNVTVNERNIADLLEEKGKTWKAYGEAFPGNCFTGARSGSYARKHMPFISFSDIQSNAKRCAHIVNADQFKVDVANNALPDFSYYAPDMNNDGHDTGVKYADKWFSATFGPMMSTPGFKDVTLIATFDEGSKSGDNRIYTTIVGSHVKAGSSSARSYSHYDILRTLEDAWNLGTLGQSDATSDPIADIWQ